MIKIQQKERTIYIPRKNVLSIEIFDDYGLVITQKKEYQLTKEESEQFILQMSRIDRHTSTEIEHLTTAIRDLWTLLRARLR